MRDLAEVIKDYPEVKGVHKAADLFPMFSDADYAELVESIRADGLEEPIVLTRDCLLLDGRNRLLACSEARVEPRFTTYNGNDPIGYSVRQNLKRRHLDVGQRAMAGLEAEAAYAEEAKQRQGTRTDLHNPGGLKRLPPEERGFPLEERVNFPADLRESSHDRESSSRAAKVVGVSPRAIQQAKAVKKYAPQIVEKVRRGEVSLDAAHKVAMAMAKAQPKVEVPKPRAETITLLTHDGEAFEYPKPHGKATFNETKGDGISWAAWSWNPVTGCLHGCEYCYAREIATSERFAPGFPAGFIPLFHPERLDAPANTVVPVKQQNNPAYRRVFVCSMADLYGQWVPEPWIQQVHDSMLATPEWEYLLLTKFPSRFTRLELPPNAWVGTSVDEQARVRIAEDAFRKIEGVKYKWLSLEPLRTPLVFSDLSMFDWVVIGAQTETRQPEGIVPAFSPPWQWVIEITKQALDAGCKVHWKPNLRNAPGMVWPDEYPE